MNIIKRKSVKELDMDKENYTGLTKLTADLSNKNIRLRAAMKKTMEIWEDVTTCGEYIYADTPLYSDGEIDFYLTTGYTELRGINPYTGTFTLEIDENKPWIDAITIPRLRDAIRLFPFAVEEIKNKMLLNQKETEEMLDFCDKVCNANAKAECAPQ